MLLIQLLLLSSLCFRTKLNLSLLHVGSFMKSFNVYFFVVIAHNPIAVCQLQVLLIEKIETLQEEVEMLQSEG